MALSQMMKNYVNTKEQYKDCVLFYRLGDFYEMFFEDAQRVSKLLGITLTGRDCGDGQRAPMCGVPFHSADTYIAKLIALGEKVAICEQLSEPIPGKIVQRDVVRVITPGTVMEENLLQDNQNNYIACVYAKDPQHLGLAWLDISTGEFSVQEIIGKDAQNKLDDLLVSITPSEIIANNTAFLMSFDLTSVKLHTVPKFYKHIDAVFELQKASEILLKQFGIGDLKIINCQDRPFAVVAVGALLDYLTVTQKRELKHINHLKVVQDNNFMHLDINTRLNLEICESLSERKKFGSLLWVLDKTMTPMGARKLRNYLEHPLQDYQIINDRLDAVEELTKDNINRTELMEALKYIGDIERLCAKVAYGNLTPRNCVTLGATLGRIPQVKAVLGKFKSKILSSCFNAIDDFSSINDMLERAFISEPPNTIKDGGFIKIGFDAQLDEYLTARIDGKTWISQLEAKEKELTGLRNLKIAYNKIMGYYFEVPKSNSDMLPFRFDRLQTLTNNERFMTKELKNLQETMLNAEENAIKLELELFNKIRSTLLGVMPALQTCANAISEVDVLVNFAEVALNNNYHKPVINTDIHSIKIVEGRHPIVEKLNKDEKFVPNDTILDAEQSTLIITGPNMSGKSTYMRQVALITFMAHVGCFVPATEAYIKPIDRIFTRIGASDNLGRGQSTFMVEMVEVANILQNATQDSLLILDEIGRGTSTYDGLSIAWAVVEQISNHIHASTLFATHYHELTVLEGQLPAVKNYKVLVKEFNNTVMFLRKIVRGSADKSFGIEVAKLAGIPENVTDRAKQILYEHENQENKHTINTLSDNAKDNMVAISQIYNEIKDYLNSLDVNYLSPIEAFAKLNELKQKVK
ncbi:MAG: DNA mismatch repair protein MutS [Clostridia bacterium]|nr:DNA mismatch repair protein MutS [Clostridia bacterium]